MAWQDVLPLSVTRIDAEQERELRLAAQARAGAEWALAALVARYQPGVTRYLTRLTGDADLASALAERIFLRMDRRLRGPHGGHQLRLWLLRACTEAGLDAVRRPPRISPAQLESPRFAGLLTGRMSDGTTNRLRAGWETLTEVTGTTRRQVRKLIWNSTPPEQASTRLQAATAEPSSETEPATPQDPREALRYRLIRAVLAELPYGDAQCLALHLVASLNQAEVARALGITQSATRRRIVHGLQLFAQRYEAAAASLGLPPESLVSQSADLIEEPFGSADLVATVATAVEAPALAPSPAAPSQPLPTQPVPIWNGAYAGPGEDVGLSSPPAELFVAAVTEGIRVQPETIVDAAPLVVMSACEDRMVVVAPEPQLPAMELALTIERVFLSTEGTTSNSAHDTEIPSARLVPVLTPGAVVAHDDEPDALAVATQVAERAWIVAPANDSTGASARLVPVLTPGAPGAPSAPPEPASLTIIVDGAPGTFGGPSAPTMPLPGRIPRRAALTMAVPDEQQPVAG